MTTTAKFEAIELVDRSELTPTVPAADDGLQPAPSSVLSAGGSSQTEERLLDKSTADDSEEGAALQSGDRATCNDMRFFGIYYSTCLVGFYLSLASTPLLYAIFTKLIGLPSYRVAGAGQVMSLWWSFKAWFGSLSDCHPLFGYRRKSYILIGYTCAGGCLLLIIMFGQPYKDAPAWQWLVVLFFFNMFCTSAPPSLPVFPVRTRSPSTDNFTHRLLLSQTCSAMLPWIA